MSSTMSSSPFLPPLQGPSLRSFSSAQPTKLAVLQQFGGCGRHQTEQRQGDKKVALVRKKLDNRIMKAELKDGEFDHYFRYIKHRLSIQPELWYISPLDESQKPPPQLDVDLFVNSPLTMVGSTVGTKNESNDVIRLNALLPSKDALLVSKEAAALTQFSDFTDADSTASRLPSLDEPSSIEKIIVRSGRLLERRSRKRKRCKYSSTMGTNKTIAKTLISNDPLALLQRGNETKQQLSIKEERHLLSQVEELMKVEAVKKKFHLRFGHEPTLTEWAKAVGMSSHELQSCLAFGERSRDKILYANFGLVGHIANHYQGKGLSFQDLFQAGCMGLMRSLEKFKLKFGCRFSTYAYWWIRQSIKKAIYRHSRTIRLPENMFHLLKKVKRARMLCIMQGHYPSDLDLAKLVGISVEKLEQLKFVSRNPVSIQGRVWPDQNVTIQSECTGVEPTPLVESSTRLTQWEETTEDPSVETPDRSVDKEFMRQDVRKLLQILPPRERQIIHLRYGLHDGAPKSLQEIGNVYGITRERVRQLESWAMKELKRCAPEQGLQAYIYLLT